MIDIISNVQVYEGGHEVLARVSGSQRVRQFMVHPNDNGPTGGVKELRQVGRQRLYCVVRDAFLCGELRAVVRAAA